MDSRLYREITVKFSVQMDSITHSAGSKLERIEHAVDSKGEPIDAFYIKRDAFSGWILTENNVTISSAEFNSILKKWFENRHVSWAVETIGDGEDRIYAMVFSLLAYRMEFVKEYEEILVKVFKEVFDVDLEV